MRSVVGIAALLLLVRPAGAQQAPQPVIADIVDVEEGAKGLTIIMNAGSNVGVAAGWHGHIRGVRDSDFTITKSRTNVSVTVLVIPTQVVMKSSMQVELTP